MRITIPYKPRSQQAYLHKELLKYRYALLLCHRRFGKTTMCLNHLIRAALTNKNHNPRYSYIAPTYKQAKSIAWDFLKHYAKPIVNTRFNETELRCDLPNGSRITLLGAENAESLRGLYFDGIILDEMASIQASVLEEILTPALSDRKGFMYLVGTPQGMQNIFYDYYLKAQGDKKWFLYVAKANETKIIDQEELTQALEMLGQAKYNQEFECSFIGNIPGSIYGKEIEDLEDKKRLTSIPFDPSHLVNTSFDIGYNDDTAIIFFQNIGHQINIIDCFADHNQPFPYYAEILKEKPYSYGYHLAPHDIEVSEYSSGKTRREVAYQHGIKFRVVPKTLLDDGIHSVKMILPRCKIDVDHCKPLIDALRHYHRKYSEKDRIFQTKPVRDWSSHYADSFRYLATGFQEEKYSQSFKQTTALSAYKAI
jgi:phage terminase large subunit